MAHVFKKHYTREEAQALLPQLRKWLDRLLILRAELGDMDGVLAKQLGLGDDLGGELVNRWVRVMTQIRDILSQFAAREIQIKDLDRGLLDFPAFIGGKEVFLCWEKGEDAIEFWHDLETGYGGRERL